MKIDAKIHVKSTNSDVIVPIDVAYVLDDETDILEEIRKTYYEKYNADCYPCDITNLDEIISVINRPDRPRYEIKHADPYGVGGWEVRDNVKNSYYSCDKLEDAQKLMTELLLSNN